MRFGQIAFAAAAALASVTAAGAQSVGDAPLIGGSYANGDLTFTLRSEGAFSAFDPQGAEIARGAWRYEGDVIAFIDDEEASSPCPDQMGVYAVSVVQTGELNEFGAPLVDTLTFALSDDACEARIAALDGQTFRNVALSEVPFTDERFAGAWSSEDVTFHFSADGFAVGFNRDNELGLVSRFELEADRLTLRDLGGPGACPASAEGVYGWAIEDETQTLTLSLMSDDCARRHEALVGDWARSGNAP